MNHADILLAFAAGEMTRPEAVGYLMDLGEDWFDAQWMIDNAMGENYDDRHRNNHADTAPARGIGEGASRT